MNVQPLSVTREQATAALREYKAHRNVYDKRDWEIERIYRQIARGKTVISAFDAIRRAGIDAQGRPRLALCEADATHCLCERNRNEVIFGRPSGVWRWQAVRKIRIPWTGFQSATSLRAALPRIPPQYRPVASALSNYHILWEADWQDIPRDPYLLRRIGKDAWVVLAAWELTDVELSALRARPN
jgi:hypothetical protein